MTCRKATKPEDGLIGIAVSDTVVEYEPQDEPRKSTYVEQI